MRSVPIVALRNAAARGSHASARFSAVLTDVGAVQHIEREIERRADQAVAVLEASSATGFAKQQLAALATKATQRAH